MSTNEFAAIETLDLAPIKMKLMHAESGEGWSALRATAVEAEYRRFLHLMKKYPDAGASPSVDVDTFWHYHILDTMKYAIDCEAVFGYFLHHYPYVGIGASANDGDHAMGGQRMRDIYEAEFGVQAANTAYAYCTSPGKPYNAASAVYAYCTSPGKPGEAANAAHYAYCTSPGTPADTDASAYCTSPGKPCDTSRALVAYCTSPGKPGKAANAANYAYCTSPGKPQEAAYAYCTSPGKPGAAAYAYCTSPGAPRTAIAYCTSPGTPREAANAAYAYCTSPGKPSQSGAAAADKELAAA